MTSPHDLTIYWGNKDTYNRFKVALDIQDAGNLRAIAREFVKVVDAAAEETRSTEATWADPAVVLLVRKMDSLTMAFDHLTLSKAFDECAKRAETAPT